MLKEEDRSISVDPIHSATQDPSSHQHSLLVRILRILLPVVVLAAGVFIVLWMMETKPQAKPRPQARNAALVEVQRVEYGPQRTQVDAMGTVVAARQVELKPQVSGEILTLSDNLVPGGYFRTGETLLRIDPTDYRLTVRQLASEVAQIESDLQLEQGNQLIAQKEYELLGQPVTEAELSLILRQPQLDSLRASLEAAQVKLEQAKVDLARTEISAPFNAVVQTREVNVGSRVGESTALATLVGTDEYWVEVSVPVSQLRWIKIPQAKGEVGSLVKIFDNAAWGAEAYREGRVIRLAAGLETQGRMARLLVQVKDPLALSAGSLGKPRLLIDSYVQVQIEGLALPSAVALDRSLLRDGDNLWLLDDQGRLEIRPVSVAFKGRDQALITAGVAPGEQLVTSDLAAPVAGMALRVSEDKTQDGNGVANSTPKGLK